MRNHTTEVSKPVQTTVIPPVAQETHETSSRPSAKDALPVLKEQPPSGVPALLPLSAPVPPVHREDVRVSSQMISQNAIEPRLRRSQSKISRIGEPVPAESVIHEQALATDPVAQSDGVYIDENGAIQIYEFEHPTDHIEETVELAGVRIPSQLPKAIGPMPTESVALTDLPVAEEKIESVQKHVLPPVSEPEEYWDEDGADNYDEEGYVTARSFKSRTDNTTGNATIVLFPKVTQRVKKEIAAAKLHIEASKTVEELEDEAWDTTMVAEYGDEIFQYMKELEVCSAHPVTAPASDMDRSKCCPTLIIWTIKLKFSGPCAPCSWIGSCKSTIVSICCQKPCSCASTALTAFSRVKWSL